MKSLLDPDSYEVGEIIEMCGDPDCKHGHTHKFKVLKVRRAINGSIVQYYNLADGVVQELTLIDTPFDLQLPVQSRTLYHMM